jgi:Domain of unknown function (DUF4105)
MHSGNRAPQSARFSVWASRKHVNSRSEYRRLLQRSASLAAWLLFAAVAAVGADENYLGELMARARQQKLASDPQWLALGYWQPNLIGGGSTSLIDNPGFFLAADGKSDPAKELESSLAAFFEPTPENPDQHPQCLKPARYRWLKARLGFDPARLSEQSCPRLRSWEAELDPDRVTLIFPAAYINNPSSMFGHTLIRFDPPAGLTEAPLTARTVHFAADHRGEQGAFFALKGLTGYYQGYFALLPYYEKVTQYSDIENRDIWEYELAFEREQIRMMLASLWEVDLQPINYYFFSTNCSYVLLSLLKVGRPDLPLTEPFPIYAIPVDTVRSVIDKTGLLRGATFRSSQRTQIGERWRRLDDHARSIALALAEGEIDADDSAVRALSPPRRAAVLELAQAYLQYRLDTANIDRDEMAPRSLALLRVRSRISGAESPPTVPTPEVRPDQGHHSARLAAGAGMTGDRPFAELALRPAYHDLLDPVGGYVPGAAIDFLGIHVRWYDSAVPSLETATLIGIESLTPRNELFQALSWRVRFGVDRFRDRPSQPGDIVGSAGGGAGPTWALADSARVYALADAALLADRHWPDGRLFTLGPAFGLLWSVAPWWTVRPEGRWALLVEDGARDTFEATLHQGFALGRDLSLRLTIGVRNDGDETYGEWSTLLAWYF